jgi:hypothetical protein
VRGDRARGVVLYACAALLLAGGALWWFRAAPHGDVDPRIEKWRADAERLLPDVIQQDQADTVAIDAGADREVTAEVDTGKYLISVLCVGGPDSQVRVSLGEAGTDSGRGLNCEGGSQPDNFTVGTAGQLRMNVTVNPAGPVVFRYSLLRQADP